MFRNSLLKLSTVSCIAALALAGCGKTTTDSDSKTITLKDPAFSTDTTNAFSKNTDRELVFSAIPDTAGSELAEKFALVAAHLSEELGVSVRYQPSSDYGASVEAFTNGDIHFAWFGGLTGVQAMLAVPGSAAIVQGEADPMYYSYFIAHKDSELPEWNGEDDQPFPVAMGGMTFTFGSEKSTSGRLMPEYFIRENTDQAPADFFDGAPGFSGSHDNTVAQVNAGTYMVGAVNYKKFNSMSAEGLADNAYIVWKTPYYADYNLTARGDLDTVYGVGSTARLQEVLIAIDDPQLLAAFDREALIAAKNSDFQGIADVAAPLDFISE